MASVTGYTKARMDTLLALLAPLISPALTGNPTAPTPAPGDNDTSIATTAFVAASQAAQLVSPTFTGDPKAPTPTVGDNDTSIATTAFVATALANLVNASPAALDTLKELADAIGDDPNFAATMATSLGLKAPLISPTFTGDPKAPTPSPGDNDTSIATTAFVVALLASYATLASPTFTGTPSLPTGTTGVTQTTGDSSTKLATTAFVQLGKTKTVNAQVGTTYTPVLADGEKAVEITNASAISVTIPLNATVAFPVGTIIQFAQLGAGKITLSPAGGVTINSPGGLLGTRVQYSTITLRKRGTDTWLLSDDVG